MKQGLTQTSIIYVALLVAAASIVPARAQFGPKRVASDESGQAGVGNVDNGRVAQQAAAKCEGKDCAAGGKGDPVFTSFDGQQFEFHGQPGHFYNLASEKSVFQLSTLLKPASMFNHNGTYLKGVGLKHKNVEIVVEAGPDFDSSLTVEVDRQLLDLGEENMLRKTVLAEDGSEVVLLWEMYRKNFGPMVEITTASAIVRVHLTAPAPDEGGVMQPNYLNVNVTLLDAPASDLQGIIGESYNHVSHLPATEYQAAKAEGRLAEVPRPSYPLFSDNTYEIDGYFTSPIRQTIAQLLKRLHLKMPHTAPMHQRRLL